MHSINLKLLPITFKEFMKKEELPTTAATAGKYNKYLLVNAHQHHTSTHDRMSWLNSQIQGL